MFYYWSSPFVMIRQLVKFSIVEKLHWTTRYLPDVLHPNNGCVHVRCVHVTRLLLYNNYYIIIHQIRDLLELSHSLVPNADEHSPHHNPRHNQDGHQSNRQHYGQSVAGLACLRALSTSISLAGCRSGTHTRCRSRAHSAGVEAFLWRAGLGGTGLGGGCAGEEDCLCLHWGRLNVNLFSYRSMGYTMTVSLTIALLSWNSALYKLPSSSVHP